MPRPFRFVHAADLHLDAPFAGIDAEDPRVRDALMGATFAALDRVVDACVRRSADALLIAGDVYDEAVRSLGAQFKFQKAMRRLAEAGIEVFVAHGNHDPLSGWTLGLELPESVHVFDGDTTERFQVVRDGEVLGAVYGRSFARRDVRENLAATFHREPGDRVAVGVLHTNVGGRPDFEDYAPCTTDDLRRGQMDYWALGHIHLPGPVLDEPVAWYSGCTQGLNPKESGPRGCLLVEAGDDGVRTEWIETCAVRWEHAAIDVTGTPTIDALRARLSDICSDLRREAGGVPIVARIDITGPSAVHDDLRREGVVGLLDDLRDEQLASSPWLWVDRLRDHTRRAVSAEDYLGEQGFAGELVRRAAEMDADALVAELLEPLRGSLPQGLEFDQPAELLTRARDLSLDLLVAEGD